MDRSAAGKETSNRHHVTSCVSWGNVVLLSGEAEITHLYGANNNVKKKKEIKAYNAHLYAVVYSGVLC